MKDVSRVMSASSTQSPQTKIYLAKNSGGIQKRAFVPTVLKPFKFYTESRDNNSPNKENSPNPPFIPLAYGVQQFLESPTRFDAKTGKLRSNTLTVPKSPYLRTKYRSKPTTILPSPTHVIKANPVPDYKEPYRPVIEHRLIELPMFSLPGEEISKRKSQEIEERIRQENEKMEKMREFKAQPLPTGFHNCPTRPYYSPTHPKPFALLTNDRGEKYQREFYEKVRKEQEYYKENRFHAQPLPNFKREVPRKPECPPPTEPIGFFFFTDTRMEERHIFDEHRRFREKEAEEQRLAEIREKEIRNAEEIRRLRANLVHHAQPIRYYTPINIKPSNKKPTRPISPMIGEKRRKYRDSLSKHV
ncbi:hypothetical protein GLOIN_2v1664071 [Rhizophagus irregularis DAOM 181602=DAOM 197198]|nr:hypothetical protein GLOIN_2v1664071 [Rhizophagus irregularis DAOM 181602=DAOM 197198]POG65643.1 hypothetical protein GLOIN_2v1664071 [Rhizophagus irregularis DAOM 181602=DAOM 197198]|eukprot:XP_025172509.1 hypothetical protein GLOIN_2v1664071 [Rhizophagus irregularis DAOM 181602=DAOM 197198]